MKPSITKSRLTGHWIVDSMGQWSQNHMQHREGFRHWEDALKEANAIARCHKYLGGYSDEDNDEYWNDEYA